MKPEDLTKMARTLPGYRGNKRLREVIRLSDRGAASPGESWIRVAVVKSGFPRPDTQIPVMGRHGRWLYVDLGYPDFQVGLEYDGERHHSGRRAREHDARRRDWLAKEMGWEIIPVTKSFLHRPAPYLEALLTAMLPIGRAADHRFFRSMEALLTGAQATGESRDNAARWTAQPATAPRDVAGGRFRGSALEGV